MEGLVRSGVEPQPTAGRAAPSIGEVLSRNAVPLGALALGGTFLGLGRQGSPASQLGMGLVYPTLAYYTNQSLTADERARKQRIEDEWLQRQYGQQDLQNQRAMLEAKLRGGYKIVKPGTAGAEPQQVGPETIYVLPPREASLAPIRGVLEMGLGPEAAAEFDKAYPAGTPIDEASRTLPSFMQVLAMQRTQRDLAGRRAGYLEAGRPQQQVQETLGFVPGSRSRPTAAPTTELVGPPPLMSPEEALFYASQVGGPGEAQAVREVGEALKQKRFESEDILRPILEKMGGAAGGPGVQRTSVQMTKEQGGPARVALTISPPSASEQESARQVADTRESAGRLATDPGAQALRGQLSENERAFYDLTLSEAARTGDVNLVRAAHSMLAPQGMTQADRALVEQTRRMFLGRFQEEVSRIDQFLLYTPADNVFTQDAKERRAVLLSSMMSMDPDGEVGRWAAIEYGRMQGWPKEKAYQYWKMRRGAPAPAPAAQGDQ